MEDMGKKLYNLYVENMFKQNIGVDEWDDLSPEDQQAWRWTADSILNREF